MISERIKNLRAQMALSEVDAWIITGTDPHQSEYVAPRWRTREKALEQVIRYRYEK